MLPLLFLAPALCLANLAFALTIEKDSLRTQGLRRPKGISTSTPTLSWRLLGESARNESQIAYQVQAASTSRGLLDQAGLWDTGKVNGTQNSALYSGDQLASRFLVYWRVRVWDNNNRASQWSEVETFELGLLHSSDWSAQWITNNDYQLGNTSLPLFARPFEVACPVTNARLYLLGLGMQSVLLNGEEVTDEVLAPGYSNFNKTLIYTTYDISPRLTQGTNVVGVELGRGNWHADEPLGDRYTKYTAPGVPLILIAQLEYTCQNGTRNTVTSDESWKTFTNGPMLESAWYGGEEYDSTREIPDWSSPKSDLTNWTSATLTKGPPGNLEGPQYPPLKIVDTISPINITGPIEGQYIIDFGVNFAGWFSLNLNELNGKRVTMWPCERLTSQGGLDQSTTGEPIYDAFTSAGVPQIYTPKFMYHGFRYLAVNTTSRPSLSDAQGLVIRSDSEPVGTVQTSDPMLNDIHRIIDRAIQSNLYTVMTDCPHREKLGWLEQTHLVFQPVTRGYDIQAYGRGIVQTMVDSQTNEGLIPDIAPEFVVFDGGYRDDPNWGNAVVLLPLMLYQTYGDVDLLEQAYPTMERYVEYLESQAENSTLAYGLGDWIAFDTSTPVGITATFGYYQALKGMRTIAAALEKPADSAKYGKRISELLASFQYQFAKTENGTSTYGSGSQASNAIALDIGAVPTEHRAQVTQNIVDSIVENDNHLTVGEIALPSLFRVLQSEGHNDILYKMVTAPTSPSYAYQVLNGATSLTEHWDGATPNLDGAGSLNHFMLGYADQWLSELSGLSQAENSVAWETINFSPILVTNLTSASSSYRTHRGLASASWKRSDGIFSYNVTVPVGATGLVAFDLVTLDVNCLRENGVILTPEPQEVGIISVDNGNDTVVVQIGSGQYYFTASKGSAGCDGRVHRSVDCEC